MKTNSKELHKALTAIIKQRVATVYYENIPKPVTYPYAVFSLRLLGTASGQQRYQLDVDVASRDIQESEDLSDRIQDDLDYVAVSNEKLYFHTYRSTRYAVVEEDKGIERRHLTFELYFYSREN